MYKHEDLALNNLQWLICHKTQPNQIFYAYVVDGREDFSKTKWLFLRKIFT